MFKIGDRVVSSSSADLKGKIIVIDPRPNNEHKYGVFWDNGVSEYQTDVYYNREVDIVLEIEYNDVMKDLCSK